MISLKQRRKFFTRPPLRKHESRGLGVARFQAVLAESVETGDENCDSLLIVFSLFVKNITHRIRLLPSRYLRVFGGREI